ncbi:SMP-30/gluconolactonase/LRE family protein [Paenibacillus sp. MER TA 81-3]|uniref:SMP-30/gluconolactonase/LRE family protein n=1 Tax=Paenibacillus sp. MER TA 81-3 TaxID=2939573 RepID=UPI0025597877|nr:SMP-30/gluconolactonase/LRE family protein [Paenibacillus sp. MER TA 81-3]
MLGGPLALVRAGDDIELDISARRLHLDVPEEELARRVTLCSIACYSRMTVGKKGEMGMQAELVVDRQAILGEGPVWDERLQRLYWVDITAQFVFHWSPREEEVQAIQMEQMVGAVALTEVDDTLLLALRDGLYVYHMETGQTELCARPEETQDESIRFNDGKCDPAGRFLAGTMSKIGKPQAGKLYQLEQNGQLSTLLDGVSTSNGLAWSLDHRTFYYIDTPTLQVRAWDYEVESGNISHPRAVITFAPEQGYPDGMTIDTEGMLWIAHWGGGGVSRWDPHTGRQIGFVAVPASHVTSCAFGGRELNELYITTAREGLSEAQMQAEPHAGSLFRIVTDVQGMPTFRYG